MRQIQITQIDDLRNLDLSHNRLYLSLLPRTCNHSFAVRTSHYIDDSPAKNVLSGLKGAGGKLAGIMKTLEERA